MKTRKLICFATLAVALGVGSAGLSCELADAARCDPDELDLNAGVVGDFGAGADAQKIEAFFESTWRVQRRANELAQQVETACRNIGTAVGLAADEMNAPGANPTLEQRVRAACARVATEIRAIIGAAVPTGAFLSVRVTPAVCNVEADAYARCAGGCNVNVEPGRLRVECEPGTVKIGRCEASCSGECRVQASATCAGECSAQCTGGCTGNCYGGCDGTCSYIDGSGNCAGACTGTCTGQCDATCTGQCSGYCEARVDGACTGECHGECTDWGATPPRCESFVRPPEVDAQCHASCEAGLRAEVTCTNPEVAVNYGTLGGTPEAQARLRTLVGALRTNLPPIYKATVAAGEAVIQMVRDFFGALDGLAGSITAMLDAAACAVVALGVNVQVTATFQASFEASGSITASATAQGGASI